MRVDRTGATLVVVGRAARSRSINRRWVGGWSQDRASVLRRHVELNGNSKPVPNDQGGERGRTSLRPGLARGFRPLPAAQHQGRISARAAEILMPTMAVSQTGMAGVAQLHLIRHGSERGRQKKLRPRGVEEGAAGDSMHSRVMVT